MLVWLYFFMSITLKLNQTNQNWSSLVGLISDLISFINIPQTIIINKIPSNPMG